MTQQEIMNRQFKELATKDAVFFHLLPTLMPGELAKLIERAPERWIRYRAFLTTTDYSSYKES